MVDASLWRGVLSSIRGGGRWLLPWICVLIVAATIAHMADQALTHAAGVEPDVINVKGRARCTGSH